MKYAKRSVLRTLLQKKIADYERQYGELVGITDEGYRNAFIEQILDAIRRIKFFEITESREISLNRKSPQSNMFDPLKAAILQKREGNYDEACWLVFLATHFGKHKTQGWQLVKEIYKGKGIGKEWNWINVSKNVASFEHWLEAKNSHWTKNKNRLSFGSHRKYESLGGLSQNGTGAVVRSYVRWIEKNEGHKKLFAHAIDDFYGDKSKAFDHLYASMNDVHRFGRLGKFDFLTMLGKIGLTSALPGTPYLSTSTGPIRGARMLTAESSSRKIDQLMTLFGNTIDVEMQVVEDALCNWQKSPHEYKPFRG